MRPDHSFMTLSYQLSHALSMCADSAPSFWPLDKEVHYYIIIVIFAKASGDQRPHIGDINASRIRCKLKYKNAIKEVAVNDDNLFNETLRERELVQ